MKRYTILGYEGSFALHPLGSCDSFQMFVKIMETDDDGNARAFTRTYNLRATEYRDGPQGNPWVRQ